ncbi:hypothetical protein [uncultured Shewanella sp.]|uniref:hypothetical protein n=1 Tax=uncultured Shewanella sp. TaxID=173975 RepID=UPI0026296E0D|nr:hypothetical protein [uncultured Shewanella sp.]
MSLDSIYAIVARPPRQVDGVKRNVKKVSDSDSISADSHEAPQSQLPPETKLTPKDSSASKASQHTDDNSKIKHIDIEV